MKDPPIEQATTGARVARILAQSAAIIAVGSVSGLLANLVHPRERLEWIASKPYDITVPCPEPVGTAVSVPPQSPLVRDFTTLVIDARSADEYLAWHLPGAINVPFDWLGPPVQDDVKQLAGRVAASGAKRLLVYGDGDNPDSGREWARLLSGGGIRNVSYVEGGAPLLRGVQAPASAAPAVSSSVSSAAPVVAPATEPSP